MDGLEHMVAVPRGRLSESINVGCILDMSLIVMTLLFLANPSEHWCPFKATAFLYKSLKCSTMASCIRWDPKGLASVHSVHCRVHEYIDFAE